MRVSGVLIPLLRNYRYSAARPLRRSAPPAASVKFLKLRQTLPASSPESIR